MLANDSTEANKRSGFLLVVHARQSIAELMLECPKCSTMTTYGLELAWRLRTVTCNGCALSMHVSTDDMRGLREQLLAARLRIDDLIGSEPE
jgi:hypothetical protein